MAYNLLDIYNRVAPKGRGQRLAEGIGAGIGAAGQLGGALMQRGEAARTKQQELEEMQGALGLERQQLDQELQSLNDRLLEVDPESLDTEAAAFYAAEKRSIDKRRAELDEAEGRMPESFTFRNVKRESLPTIGERKDVTPRIGDIKQAQAEKRTEQARIQAEINAKQKAEAEEKWQREFEQDERKIAATIASKQQAADLKERKDVRSEEKHRRLPSVYRKDFEASDSMLDIIDQSIGILQDNTDIVGHVNARVDDIISLRETGSMMDTANAMRLSGLEQVAGDYDPENDPKYKEILLAIEQIAAPIRSKRFGAALSKKDIQLAERSLPKVGDSFEDLMFKLNTLREIYARAKEQVLRQAEEQGYSTAGYRDEPTDFNLDDY